MLARVIFPLICCLALTACASDSNPNSHALSGEVVGADQTKQEPAWPGDDDAKSKAKDESAWPDDTSSSQSPQDNDKDKNKDDKPESLAEDDNQAKEGEGDADKAKQTKGETPWPKFLGEGEARTAPKQGCYELQALPKSTELAHIDFAPYKTQVASSGSTAQLIKVIARSNKGNEAPLYLAGTSYNPSLSAKRLKTLALKRARSVAQALAKEGIEPERLHCVPLTGKRPPKPDLDRVVVISVGENPSD